MNRSKTDELAKNWPIHWLVGPIIFFFQIQFFETLIINGKINNPTMVKKKKGQKCTLIDEVKDY